MVDRMIDPHPRVSAAGPAALSLALCVAVASLIVLGGSRAGPLAADAASLLWWPATGFWFLAAIVALRRREGLWVFASAPLVLVPLAAYGLLAIYCWDSCEL